MLGQLEPLAKIIFYVPKNLKKLVQKIFWTSFPNNNFDLQVLLEKFGLERFRSLQVPVINATLSQHDCFVMIPTGSGKSLCYQLPATLMTRITIIVTPLKSLMLDQINNLTSLGVSLQFIVFLIFFYNVSQNFFFNFKNLLENYHINFLTRASKVCIFLRCFTYGKQPF